MEEQSLETVINLFCRVALEYPHKELRTILPLIWEKLTPEQKEEMDPYFMIVMKTGEAVRKAPPEVLEIIKEDLGMIENDRPTRNTM